MRHGFRGKWGGLIAFLMITALVVGGLGWVTAAALRLEREQLDARNQAELSRREAEFTHKLQLALWQLDSRIYNDFANEANRPYEQFYARQANLVAPQGDQPVALPVTVCEVALVPGADPTPWSRRYFFVAPVADWATPQVLRDALLRHLSLARPKGQPPRPEAEPEPPPQALNKLWARINSGPQQEPPPPGLQNLDPQSQAQASNNLINNNDMPEPRQKIDQNTALRINRAAAEKLQNPYQSRELGDNKQTGQDNQKKGVDQVLVVVGPLYLVLLTEGGEEQLIVARLVQIGDKLVAQVALVDWPRLEQVLAGQIRDLFPEAHFQLVRESSPPHPERTMTYLPVEIDPGAVESPIPEGGSTSLRWGLAAAWAAALIALLTVGLGGWSLLNFSERRMRFVSAVTHELRSPLTTLRLYLDMLTGGLVKDEKQKTEYLHTLNDETNRLNRLIGNVLDFSRLENQRPRLNKTKVVLAELLEQVHATWQGRCQDVEKELILESGFDKDTLLETDVELVQQVLANLIDNACKYSRGAEDRRIWLRARREEQRLVLEVEDRGPGVPTGERRSIFRAFRRGRSADVIAGGVGLGLALAQRWARLLGGKLTLGSCKESVGACFRLELPL